MDIKKNKPADTSAAEEIVQVNSKVHKYWIGGYAACAAICITFYFLLNTNTISFFSAEHTSFAKNLFLGATFGFFVLACGKLVEMLLVKKAHSKSSAYNLVKLIRLITIIIICMVIISFLFHNWYTAAVSLGIFSLILGFALQVPISSFIAWLYIIIRSPYRVGDRIEISPFTGDVVEINYLDTTLWEFGGNYLSSDLPSGRLIRFPNSLVLQSAVFNYSWPKFPYIWNEVPFHIAYGSDLEYVETTLKDATKAELDPEMAERIKDLKKLIEETPVDELQIKEYPFVNFKINANTWVEATVTYLVHPKKASVTRTKIIKHAIAELLKQPDKVMFPKGDSR